MYQRILIILTGLLLIAGLFSGLLMANGHRYDRRHLNRDDHYAAGFGDREGKGNEAAGEMAAWLLAAANLTVALSILVKWINGLKSIDGGMKKALQKFNRSQKKLLMPVHYWLNPLILVITLWHWTTSCCRSTALPEWGLLMMTVLMALGLLIKFKLCPKPLRKGVYRIHTSAYALVAMVAILTVGHLMIG